MCIARGLIWDITKLHIWFCYQIFYMWFALDHINTYMIFVVFVVLYSWKIDYLQLIFRNISALQDYVSVLPPNGLVELFFGPSCMFPEFHVIITDRTNGPNYENKSSFSYSQLWTHLPIHLNEKLIQQICIVLRQTNKTCTYPLMYFCTFLCSQIE